MHRKYCGRRSKYYWLGANTKFWSCVDRKVKAHLWRCNPEPLSRLLQDSVEAEVTKVRIQIDPGCHVLQLGEKCTDIAASNDKDHDTWFVQHAMKRQATWLKNKGKELFPGLADTEGNVILTEHLVRSDGAGSHFKNKFTFHFLGDYRESEELDAVAWDIGCPGHGKGPWDGIAGFIKRTLRARIIDGQLVLEDEHAVYVEVSKLCDEFNEKLSLGPRTL